jgi:hypothetical protein
MRQDRRRYPPAFPVVAAPARTLACDTPGRWAPG